MLWPVGRWWCTALVGVGRGGSWKEEDPMTRDLPAPMPRLSMEASVGARSPLCGDWRTPSLLHIERCNLMPSRTQQPPVCHQWPDRVPISNLKVKSSRSYYWPAQSATACLYLILKMTVFRQLLFRLGNGCCAFGCVQERRITWLRLVLTQCLKPIRMHFRSLQSQACFLPTEAGHLGHFLIARVYLLALSHLTPHSPRGDSLPTLWLCGLSGTYPRPIEDTCFPWEAPPKAPPHIKVMPRLSLLTGAPELEGRSSAFLPWPVAWRLRIPTEERTLP